MTDRPIIFSAPMVRALLAGDKTMTRRPLYTKRRARNGIIPASGSFLQDHPPGGPISFEEYWSLSPWCRAQPGDRLWVRESISRQQGEFLGIKQNVIEASYAADHAEVLNPHDFNVLPWWKGKGDLPSIHMPRWASRITLVVTATKIERLQDISLLDVRAEGCEVRQFWLFGADGPERQKIGARVFGNLWEEIHGRESWEANPEVVALKFRMILANIDSDTARAAA